MDGISLQERREQRPIKLPQSVEYIAQVLDAHSYAHDHGMIHRDIKPHNILLTRDGAVNLAGFGIARSVGDERMTITGCLP